MTKKQDMQVEEERSGYGTVALPEQKGFFKIPARFGHVPVAEEPLGYDRDEFFPNGVNRLFFGDCPHVMRIRFTRLK